MPKSYEQLTNRGQVRRLRQLALNALQHYDLDVTRLSLINNGFNGIFRVDTRSGEKYMLRVTLPEGGHTRQHVAAELAWLAALARDTDLSVPAPLPARDGSCIVEASAPGVPQPRLCEVFSWVPGGNLAECLTPLNLARLGALMARLHQHALAFAPPDGLDLLRYDRVFHFEEPVLLFEERMAPLISPERRALFQQAVDWAQRSIKRLQACGEPMRILHGDLHQWNVLVYRGVLSPIDFEDLMWGWPVQDIATTLYYFFKESEFEERRAAFQKGYTSVSPWPERFADEIDSFIASRALDMANFVLQTPNPDFSSDTPAFLERIEARLRRLLEKRL